MTPEKKDILSVLTSTVIQNLNNCTCFLRYKLKENTIDFPFGIFRAMIHLRRKVNKCLQKLANLPDQQKAILSYLKDMPVNGKFEMLFVHQADQSYKFAKQVTKGRYLKSLIHTCVEKRYNSAWKRTPVQLLKVRLTVLDSILLELRALNS